MLLTTPVQLCFYSPHATCGVLYSTCEFYELLATLLDLSRSTLCAGREPPLRGRLPPAHRRAQPRSALMADPQRASDPTSSPTSHGEMRQVSEAMIRLRRMLKTGVVSAGDRVEYSIRTPAVVLEFFAELAADGSIGKPHEIVNKTPRPLPDAEFDSPTAFANAMYTHGQERLQNRRRPCINGWTDCTVNGKTLTDLRYTMYLRERKHSSTSSPTASILVDTDVSMRDAQSSPTRRRDESSRASAKENTVKPTSPMKMSVSKPAAPKLVTSEKRTVPDAPAAPVVPAAPAVPAASSTTAAPATPKRVPVTDESKEPREPVPTKVAASKKASDVKAAVEAPKPSTESIAEVTKQAVSEKRQHVDSANHEYLSKRTEKNDKTEPPEKDGTTKTKASSILKSPIRSERSKNTDGESRKGRKDTIAQAGAAAEPSNRTEASVKSDTAPRTQDSSRSEAVAPALAAAKADKTSDKIEVTNRDTRDRKAVPAIRSEPLSKKLSIDRKEDEPPVREPTRSMHGERSKQAASDSRLEKKTQTDPQISSARTAKDPASPMLNDRSGNESGIQKDRGEKVDGKERVERSDQPDRKDKPIPKDADGASIQKKVSECTERKESKDPELLPDAPPPVKRVASPEPALSDKASDDTMDDNAKKKKGKTQKRKRSATPQSDEADGERSTRAKSRRRVLDPASAEAAAVAAAAEKQEAIAARRTTRLASGKISKVVYTAPSRPVSGDNESEADEPSRQIRRKEKTLKRIPKRGAKSGHEGSESGSDEEESEEEVDERKSAMHLITQVALAIQRAKTTSVSTVLANLGDKTVASSDARNMVENMLSEIRNANAASGYVPVDDSLVQQSLAYLAAEVGRWSNGQMRPMVSLSRRKLRLEKKRVTAEKLKRRAKREYDEAIAKLDAEMDSRRKVELDAAHMTMVLNALQRSLDQENEAKAALAKEVRLVKMQELDGRKRVENTKRLYEQLFETAKDNDAPQHSEAPMDTDVPIHNGTASSSKKHGQESGSMCESMTSDDERDAALPRARAPQTGSTPMDPTRAAEVERLRSLVRSRGAESEEWQRLCEMESIRLRGLLDRKNKLDTQIYRKKSKMPNLARFLAHHASAAASRHEAAVAAATGTVGANSSAAHAARNRENPRKDKGGSSKHANGNGKAKGSSKNITSGMNKSSKKSSKKEDKSKRKSSKPAAVNT